ncbi:MAG: CHRD domain-containing protein [Verrucomicrobia bacterium]|nr:CHRD domain-containing protein [Verrucomicrobiota bacterium]
MKLLISLLPLLLAAGVARSATVVYTANLNGSSEFPANASPGQGFATVTVDTILKTMEVNVVFSGLQGNVTASHIHALTAIAGSGTAGVATMTPTFAGFPSGVAAGSYDHTFDMTLTSSYNSAFITSHGGTAASALAALEAGMADGKSYLNIHTSAFGGGEIRGFLVPEPATGSMLAVACAALACYRRRHR